MKSTIIIPLKITAARERGTRAYCVARPDATGAAEAGRSHRGNRARERLERGRPRDMAAPTSLKPQKAIAWSYSGRSITSPRRLVRRRSCAIVRRSVPRRGVPVRRIDHVNLFAANREGVRDFLVDLLGFRERERVVEEDGSILASFLSVTNLSHDIAMVPEATKMRGRLHHVCFHYTSVQHVFDAAELAKEAGLKVEFGPGRHGIGGATFVYMLEPGGNRIELMGDPGYMIFDPAWRTVVWKASEFPDAAAWTGSPPPDSFLTYGTPLAEEREAVPAAEPLVQA